MAIAPNIAPNVFCDALGKNQVLQGDCLEVLKTLPDNSIDSIVTDPPYGLSFMGKKWDYDVPIVEIWQECLRVLKPGGHLLAFAGTRTHHRMAVNIEDAGFEIRDTIAWVYGSGFPKSHNLKDEWDGWGTALKPSFEPITLARKPIEGTVAQNVLEYGTGGLNIDDCRVETENERPLRTNDVSASGLTGTGGAFTYGSFAVRGSRAIGTTTQGRWPANFIHDGSDEVLELFPETKSGGTRANGANTSTASWKNTSKEIIANNYVPASEGSAARFFYCAKASKRDRDEGLDGFEEKTKRILNGGIPSAVNSDPRGMSGGGDRLSRNHHPTVKPTNLMRYLCRLITPPGGVVLDPFCGSGSTGKAAVLEGFRFLGIDREAEYVELAKARINFAISQRQPTLEERVQWLETQVQAQSAKLKNIEAQTQLSLFG